MIEVQSEAYLECKSTDPKDTVAEVARQSGHLQELVMQITYESEMRHLANFVTLQHAPMPMRTGRNLKVQLHHLEREQLLFDHRLNGNHMEGLVHARCALC